MLTLAGFQDQCIQPLCHLSYLKNNELQTCCTAALVPFNAFSLLGGHQIGHQNSPSILAREMTILKKLLESKGIQPIEAGGELAAGQNAYCTKICSKIITSQFCIVLLNNDEQDGLKIPNANVNMEYGLMLGFNKYIIPFQRKEQKLPFNLASLDTVKYTNQDFERLASDAIDQAIAATEQKTVSNDTSDQLLQMFLLGRNLVFSDVGDPGQRNILAMGAPLGFNLLNNFSGEKYVFLVSVFKQMGQMFGLAKGVFCSSFSC